MLHELLLALSGHPGDVFVPCRPAADRAGGRNSPGDAGTSSAQSAANANQQEQQQQQQQQQPGPTTFCVTPDFPFLHPAERAAFNRLAQLGFWYREVALLASAVSPVVPAAPRPATRPAGPPVPDPGSGLRPSGSPPRQPGGGGGGRRVPHGVYFRALAGAVSEALLPYQRALVSLERDLLLGKLACSAGRPALAHFRAVLSPHAHVLAFLYCLVRDVTAEPERWPGCRVLDLLHDRARRCGVPSCREAAELLLWRCRQVFLRQCAAWVVHGDLNDPTGEFLVCKVDDARRAGLKAGEPKPHAVDAEGEEECPADVSLWHKVYCLDEAVIPKLVGRSLAESILFTGKAVATLRNSKGDARSLSVDALGNAESPSSEALSPESAARHVSALAELLDSKDVCSTLDIEHALAPIRQEVARELWASVIRGPDPAKHRLADVLLSLRRYALVGRGDWATSVLDQVSRLRAARLHRSAGSAVRDGELNAAFARAVYGTTAEGDPVLAAHFRLSAEPSPRRGTDLRVLPGNPVRLRCEVPPLVDLVLSPRDAERYAVLFAFLISFRGVQVSLQRLAVGCRRIKDRNRRKIPPGESAGQCGNAKTKPHIGVAWRLKQAMLFHVDELWNHMQMDVIDAAFYDLRRRLTTPPAGRDDTTALPELWDLQDIQRAHASYLDAVEHGCLLGTPTLAGAVDALADVCRRFCTRMEAKGMCDRVADEAEDGEMEKWEAIERDVAALDAEFRQKAEKVFRIISGPAPHLKIRGESAAPEGGADARACQHAAQSSAERQRHMDQLQLRWDYSKWFTGSG